MPTEKITVEILVKQTLEKVWNYWTGSEHIVKWNFASDDWHCPFAENDVQSGGKFKSTMAAKDGSFSFDFEGIYDEVIPQQKISYKMSDGRAVFIRFEQLGVQTKITETFDAETENPIELQQHGWQAILGNFKKYAEG
jgi:uncharacterized protein YndB with AHSA1/START domain